MRLLCNIAPALRRDFSRIDSHQGTSWNELGLIRPDRKIPDVPARKRRVLDQANVENARGTVPNTHAVYPENAVRDSREAILHARPAIAVTYFEVKNPLLGM